MRFRPLLPLCGGAAILVGCYTVAPVTRPVSPNRLEYRGFVVDLGAIRSSPNYDALAQAIRRQFDLVADLALRDGIQQFFRAIPFVVDSAGFANPQYRGNLAGYCNSADCPLPQQGGRIKIVPRLFAVDNAIFLHELLHAYHDHRLGKGFDNPDILRLYEAARGARIWGDSSYAMRNPQEYFASLGSLFFYGRTGRDGLISSDVIKRRQPALYHFLVGELMPPQTRAQPF